MTSHETPHETPHQPTTPLTAAARRWVAGQLAWEDRLVALRHDQEAAEAASTLDAELVDLVAGAAPAAEAEEQAEEIHAA